LNNTGMLYSTFYHDYNKGLPLLKKAIALKPENEISWYNTGYCLENLEKFDDAIHCYSEASRLNPAYAKAISGLANCFYQNGKMQEAIEANIRLAALDSTSDAAFINIGKYYLEKHDTSSAVPWLEKAISRAPDNRNLCINLGNYFRQTGDTAKSDYYLMLAQKAKK
jgi:tetratricopeptide (TPR) repeat protein